MNITHLLCFVTVCEAGTIQNAAKELYVTPSAISQNIKMMERELDSLLFVRTTRKMELTEQGRVLYRYAKQILTLYQDALHELNTMNQQNPMFRLCLPSPHTDDYIQEALELFYRARPQAVVSIDHMTPETIRQTENWKPNTLYLISKEWIHHTKCCWVELGIFLRVCIMRPDNPLREHRSLTLNDLIGQTYYLLDTAWKDPARLDRYGLQNYLDSIHFVNVNSVATSFSKIVASGGVCIVPGYLTSYRQFGLEAVPMENQPKTALVAASRNPFTKEMKQLISCLKQALQEDY